MVHRLVLSMQQKVFYQINGCYYKARKIIGNQRQTATHSPTSHKCSRVRRKLQTIRETTFAMRGNAKPFGKWLSPCAEITNHSGNDSRHARKHQTIREITFAKRGNIKPFGKRISPCAGTPNHSGNDFLHARERQTFCGMICGSPASYINKKSTLKKWIFKVLYKRRRLPTLPHCPIWHGVPSGELRSRR